MSLGTRGFRGGLVTAGDRARVSGRAGGAEEGRGRVGMEAGAVEREEGCGALAATAAAATSS